MRKTINTHEVDTRFMTWAIKLSRLKMRAGHGGPFGAIVVKNGKIIGRGWNKVTSKNDPTAHAEVEAIRSACKKIKSFDLSECDIYTSCEPCPMCLAAIYWARIRTIYYANTRKDAAKIKFDDDFLYKEIPKHSRNRKIKMIQVLRPQALEVFHEWDQKMDKVHY